MFSDRYFLERCLRWGFSLGLVALVAVSFLESPFYKMLPGWFTSDIPGAPRCQVQLSRDFEHTAALGFPQLESLALRTRTLRRATRLAKEACRNDSTLKVIYLRQTCDGGRHLSKTVFCQ